jgi:hypothetical protein
LNGFTTTRQAPQTKRNETMAITATDKGGKDFKKVPPGCHFAICNMVVDLGVQRTTYKGQAKTQHQVYLRWEIPDERTTWEKDGKEQEGPCSIGSTYTLSLSEKAKLRAVLENWRGRPFTDDELKGFDITNVAGKCCQVMVQHETSEREDLRQHHGRDGHQPGAAPAGAGREVRGRRDGLRTGRSRSGRVRTAAQLAEGEARRARAAAEREDGELDGPCGRGRRLGFR